MNIYLEIEAERCTGCRICENFCSFHHERAIWPERARIAIVAQSDDGPFDPIVCRQCDDAACAAACTVEAIARDEHTWAWVVDVEECTGCGDCAEACPYGAIFLDEQLGVPLKCNLCGGEPDCSFFYERVSHFNGLVDTTDRRRDTAIRGPLCVLRAHDLGFATGSALWGRKSASESGELYSYGPR